MREGQRLQADQEKIAAEIEKRERRDSAAIHNNTSHESQQQQQQKNNEKARSTSPINLNLAKSDKDDSGSNGNSEFRNSSGLDPNSFRMGSSGTRGPGSESPISEKIEEDMSEEDDLMGDTPKKKTEDKVNNNKEVPSSMASLVSSLSLPGFPAGLLGADGAQGQQNLGSIYGLIGNIQALLKMAVRIDLASL